MNPFAITHEEASRACVVQLSGDVDLSIVPELRAVLGNVLEGGCVNVVLDFTGVVYADSTALGLLVWLDHKLKPVGGKLVLAGANSDVSRVLELSGLMSVASSIAMSGSAEAALDGLDTSALILVPLWTKEMPVPCDAGALGEVRDAVSAWIAELGFEESSVFDLKVALGEALANALRHGVCDEGESHVCVRAIAYPDRVVLEVEDNGPGFDGSARDHRDLYAPSGRGVMFMKALTDKVEFSVADSGGTIVRLMKRRSGQR
jgi:anti-anti-sigma factor